MNKKLFFLAMAVGIFLFPTFSLAKTFDFPSPVYVSAGTEKGVIIFGSEDPKALKMISGAVQFHNDVVKSKKGTKLFRNAWRKPEKINKYLLRICLYKPTLDSQFSFNVKSGNLWGLIPSINFIPNNETVVMEYSGPSRESEDGKGGYHFSLISHLKDSTIYKAIEFAPIELPPDSSEIIIPVSARSIEEKDLADETDTKKTVTQKPNEPEKATKEKPAQQGAGEVISENLESVIATGEKKKSKQPGELSMDELLGFPKEATKEGMPEINVPTVPVTKSVVKKGDEKVTSSIKVVPPKEKSIWIKFLFEYWWLHLILLILILLLIFNYWRKRRQNLQQRSGPLDLSKKPKYQPPPPDSE